MSYLTKFTTIGLLVAAILFSSGSTKADEVRYVAHSLDALVVMTKIIKEARHTLDLAYFIFEPCHPSGRLIVDLLKEKARSGVRVRVFLDAFLHEKDFLRRLAIELNDAGIQLKVFNRQPIKINPVNNFRMHVKLLLADNRTYISGGRNVADEYFGFAERFNFVDRDIWVTGSSAQSAAASFNELWNDNSSTMVKHKIQEVPSWASICVERVGFYPKASWIKDLNRYVNNSESHSLSRMRHHSCRNVRFITDNPNFMDAKYGSDWNGGRLEHDNGTPNEPFMGLRRLHEKRTSYELLSFMLSAKKKLLMENWSYMPLERINSALKSLRKKEVPVLVVTNMDADNSGPIKTAEDYLNHRFARRDTKGSQVVVQIASRGYLSDRHRMTPEKSFFRLHQKTGVRDGENAFVSSFNLDPRSYHTNLESMVVVENCSSFVDEMNDHSAELIRTFNKDVKSGNHQPPPPPGLGTILFAFFGFHFF